MAATNIKIDIPISYNYCIDYPFSGYSLSNYVQNDFLLTGISIGSSSVGTGKMEIAIEQFSMSYPWSGSGIGTGQSYYSNNLALIEFSGASHFKTGVSGVISGDSKMRVLISGMFSGYEDLTIGCFGIQ